MAEALAFQDPQVQGTLHDITREILTGNLVKGINDYADFRIRVTVDCPITPELIRSAIGAEALFAVWRQPIDSTYNNTLHIVKVDTVGAIIAGSETMIGAVYEDRVVHCGAVFANADVRQVEEFAQRQEDLPWQPNPDTGLYALT